MFAVRTVFSQSLDVTEIETKLADHEYGVAQLTIAVGQTRQIARLQSLTEPNKLSQHWFASSACLGVMTEQQLALSGDSIGFMQIFDPAGFYGVAAAEVSMVDTVGSVANLIQQAMAAAGQSLQRPSMIWCMQAPGQEERILSAIQAVVGPHVPIYGGSSADDMVQGGWWQYDGQQLWQNGVLIAVLYPSVAIEAYFSSGYTLGSQHATVTACQGREILELDAEPAALVYQRWTGMAVQPLSEKQTILAKASLQPLGRVVRQIEGIPLTLLSHPAYLTSSGALGLFSEVEVGERVWLMQGAPNLIRDRAAQVVAVCQQRIADKGLQVSGAFIVFCAGCMLAIQAEMPEVQRQLQQMFPEVPFLMFFSFGEQGCFVDGDNRHGNLMISATLFGNDDA